MRGPLAGSSAGRTRHSPPRHPGMTRRRPAGASVVFSDPARTGRRGTRLCELGAAAFVYPTDKRGKYRPTRMGGRGEMRGLRVVLVLAVVAAIGLGAAATASAARVSHPRKPPPAWFTKSFRQRVDAAGHRGVPVAGPGVLDICPSGVIHQGGVGTGTCLVYPYGCTANFAYYNGGSSTAPAVADGHLYLGSAGHCSDKVGQVVYAAISTPGVGASIARIGTVAKRVEQYGNNGSVLDFQSIQIDSGYHVYPASPVGGPP